MSKLYAIKHYFFFYIGSTGGGGGGSGGKTGFGTGTFFFTLSLRDDRSDL